MLRAAAVALALAAVLAFAACKGEQVLKDDCTEGGKACPKCASDDDCTIVSNSCSTLAYCTHERRDPPLASDDVTCTFEYDPPPASRCGCVKEVCRVR